MNQKEFSLYAQGDFQVKTFNYAPEFAYTSVSQVHGKKIVSPHNIPCEADGILVNEPSGPLIGIRTADCLPIIYIGKEGYAAVHAGWRGLKQKIHLDETLNSLQPQTIIIGPAISVENYEVTEEFLIHFDNQYFHRSPNQKFLFNLKKLAHDQLSATFPNAQLIDSGINTYGHPDLHSYRYNTHQKINDDPRNRNWTLVGNFSKIV